MSDTGIDIDAVERAAKVGKIDGFVVLDLIKELKACRKELGLLPKIKDLSHTLTFKDDDE